MTPLQKIAMGLVIVLVPAYFPAHPQPRWAFYDALPDPVGWALVMVGVWALANATDLELSVLKWLVAIALLASIPLWLPQVNHHLAAEYNPGLDRSLAWALSLPQTVFGLVLARTLGRAGIAEHDRYVASRFGILTWGLGALVVLPALVYGGGLTAWQQPVLLLIGIVNVALIFYLFMVNRRRWLGGPGPRDWSAIGRGEAGRPARRSGEDA